MMAARIAPNRRREPAHGRRSSRQAKRELDRVSVPGPSPGTHTLGVKVAGTRAVAQDAQQSELRRRRARDGLGLDLTLVAVALELGRIGAGASPASARGSAPGQERHKRNKGQGQERIPDQSDPEPALRATAPRPLVVPAQSSLRTRVSNTTRPELES
jgi:hypothetical protein